MFTIGIPCKPYSFALSDRLDRECFMEMIDKDPDGCWWFCGSINDQGYGETQLGETWVPAHYAAASFATRKPINDIEDVSQVCGNHLWVRPKHLRISWMEA
jgi:hypothetical protein